MITKRDSLQLQKDFKKVFATKEELLTKIEFQEFKNTFFNMVDQVMGELKTTREEQTIGAYRQSEHSDQLEDHHDRIVKLETKAFSV
jgi:hypothetical protein